MNQGYILLCILNVGIKTVHMEQHLRTKAKISARLLYYCTSNKGLPKYIGIKIWHAWNIAFRTYMPFD